MPNLEDIKFNSKGNFPDPLVAVAEADLLRNTQEEQVASLSRIRDKMRGKSINEKVAPLPPQGSSELIITDQMKKEAMYKEARENLENI